jgi:hypothetical protein
MAERQLGLFKGPRQRGVTVKPRAKEYELHCMVADTLRRWCNPEWIYTHNPMGEKRDPATAMRLKRMGVTPGWPDFMFFGPMVLVVFLELKRPGGGGRLSVAQELVSQHLTLCGHAYHCVDNYDTALSILRLHGIVRGVRVSA